ncbi:MAG: DUF3800 domain-containing protein [Gemmatimonadota bacterium]
MARLYVFADESGNLDFRPHTASGPTRYFVLTTLTCSGPEVGNHLLDLRRELAWDGLGLNSEFHATTDKQRIRDRVFAQIAPHDFRLDATILEKAKAMPHVRNTDERFYQYAWYYHMRYLLPRIRRGVTELMVVGASVGTKKRRAAFRDAVSDVMSQVAPTLDHRVASWDCRSDPCLQAADYCSWAIGRKWERDDARSYDLIKDKLVTEFDLWRNGTKLYY